MKSVLAFVETILPSLIHICNLALSMFDCHVVLSREQSAYFFALSKPAFYQKSAGVIVQLTVD